MYGVIESRWRMEGGCYTLETTIPPGSTATIYLPATSLDTVTEGGKSAAKAVGVRPVGMEGDRAVFHLQAGRYGFASTIPSRPER
jgi:alpha-L-rhamnosidase